LKDGIAGKVMELAGFSNTNQQFSQ